MRSAPSRMASSCCASTCARRRLVTTLDAAALQPGAAFQDVGARVGGRLPYVAVCAAVLCWGIGPLLVRAISASAITIAFYRLWIAAPATLLVAYLARTPLT